MDASLPERVRDLGLVGLPRISKRKRQREAPPGQAHPLKKKGEHSPKHWDRCFFLSEARVQSWQRCFFSRGEGGRRSVACGKGGNRAHSKQGKCQEDFKSASKSVFPYTQGHFSARLAACTSFQTLSHVTVARLIALPERT